MNLVMLQAMSDELVKISAKGIPSIAAIKAPSFKAVASPGLSAPTTAIPKGLTSPGKVKTTTVTLGAGKPNTQRYTKVNAAPAATNPATSAGAKSLPAPGVR